MKTQTIKKFPCNNCGGFSVINMFLQYLKEISYSDKIKTEKTKLNESEPF